MSKGNQCIVYLDAHNDRRPGRGDFKGSSSEAQSAGLADKNVLYRSVGKSRFSTP